MLWLLVLARAARSLTSATGARWTKPSPADVTPRVRRPMAVVRRSLQFTYAIMAPNGWPAFVQNRCRSRPMNDWSWDSAGRHPTPTLGANRRRTRGAVSAMAVTSGAENKPIKPSSARMTNVPFSLAVSEQVHAWHAPAAGRLLRIGAVPKSGSWQGCLSRAKPSQAGAPRRSRSPRSTARRAPAADSNPSCPWPILHSGPTKT